MTCWTVPQLHGLSFVPHMGALSLQLCSRSVWLLQMALPADYLPMHATSTLPPFEFCMQNLMSA